RAEDERRVGRPRRARRDVIAQRDVALQALPPPVRQIALARAQMRRGNDVDEIGPVLSQGALSLAAPMLRRCAARQALQAIRPENTTRLARRSAMPPAAFIIILSTRVGQVMRVG